MADCMMFPNDWAKFLEDYSFKDDKEVYTNGSSLIPTFRVEQMIENYFATDNNDGCKWIPVTERLPEKAADYLCRCVVDDYHDMPFYMVLRYILLDENPHFQHETKGGMKVTHWMPLPSPPKGENNG